MMGGAEPAAHDLGQTVQPVRCDATCAALATKLGAWPCERQRAAEGGICLFVRFFTTRRCAVRCGHGGPLPVTGQASLSVFYALNFI